MADLAAEVQSPDPGLANGLRKACDACHVAKLRCDASDALSPTGSCRRCKKYGLRCVHSFQGARRRPAQTKSERIAELERRVQELLQKRGIDPAPLPGGPDPITDSRAGGEPPVVSPSPEATPRAISPPLPEGDVIDRGLLTAAEAASLVDAYRTYLEGSFPGTWLPEDLSSVGIRRSKPILWLSVLCAGAASLGSKEILSQVLSAEMDAILSDRLSPTAEPSLEVLQAMHNYVSHHHEPTQNKLQQFLDYSKMAGEMSLRLARITGATNAEVCREVLVCYWSSMMVAIKSRERIVLSATGLMQQSIRVIEGSTNRFDRSLLAWVTLGRITFDTAIQLEDGNGENQDSIFASFEERLRQWTAECSPDIVDDQLLLEYHCSIIFISEFELLVRQPGTPSRLVRQLPSLDGPVMGADEPKAWTKHTHGGIFAAHATIDIFTKMDPEKIRYLAVPMLGRAFHALRFLFHASYMVMAGVASAVNLDSLQIETHIEALLRTLERASDGSRYKTPTVWLYALQSRLLPWYRELCRRSKPSAALPGVGAQGPYGYSAQTPHGASFHADFDETGSRLMDLDVLGFDSEDVYRLII